MHTVDMKRVSWKKNGSYILKNIDWTVGQSEHWAIIGLNGSGKTSLLKMINGYILPSEGEVSVLGKKFGTCDLRVLRKSIGWVSSSLQESLYVTESSEEIVLSGKFASIGLYDHPGNEDVEYASELMDRFGCSALRKRMYFTLSQGEKQKILLARALMCKPKLLILDEPCTGLDIFAREKFLNMVELIAHTAEPPSIIYVSHHIEEILPSVNHILFLKDGTIHSAGIKKDLLNDINLTDFLESKVGLEWKKGRPWIYLNS